MTNTLQDGKTEIICRIISQRFPCLDMKILVVGCGSGIEAAILARKLNAEVTGIDNGSQHGLNFNSEAAKLATLREEDACNMPFNDGTFDFIYSFHALEHIPDPSRALSEIKRVLSDGGGFFIGTPNRSRLIGYLGSKPGELSSKQKLYLNYLDWKARLQGRFSNSKGAHAGFTAGELRTYLSEHFEEVREMTLTYYLGLYPRHQATIKTINALWLDKLIFPSVYFMGHKHTQQNPKQQH